MAQKSTVFKADVSISDMDRHYYAEHSLVLARHPSETDERLMVRLLAFLMHADERLEFTTGLSTPDEPALWRMSLSGEIELWVDLGLPDERRLRKACGRAEQVFVLSYGGRTADLWWEAVKNKTTRFSNLTVINLSTETTAQLSALVSRGMQLQCSIDGGVVYLNAADGAVEINPDYWVRASVS